MREMGPSFVTVAAQGFYRSRVRNCYPLPKLRNLSVAELFLGKKRRRIRMDAPPLYPRPRARF